jgi:hypothetical protein
MKSKSKARFMRAFLFALFSKGVHGYGPGAHGYASPISAPYKL